VHGDYGPNNVLLDAAAGQVIAVLDWEWARVGDPVEDLAWCEWIVRMHHPEHVGALSSLFDAYGHRPAWAARQQAMAAQCRAFLALSGRWEQGEKAFAGGSTASGSPNHGLSKALRIWQATTASALC